MSDKTNRGRAVRCTTTGEVFPSVDDACAAKHTNHHSIRDCCTGKRTAVRGLSWEYVDPPRPGGGGKRWTPEEDEIIRANIGRTARDIQHLLPHRTVEAVRQRTLALTHYSARRRDLENAENRPLTEETAYQCRIEYADKIALGYTPEKAIKWVAEANMRSVEIVRDVLFNPAYDAQVAVCKRKYTDSDVVDVDACGEGADPVESLRELLRAAGRLDGRTRIPVVGTNIKTGERIVFKQIVDVAAAGFDPASVSRCVRGTKADHKGFTWRRIKEGAKL